MSLKDIFHASKIREENDDLKKVLSPEMADAVTLQKHVHDLNNELKKLSKTLESKTNELDKVNQKLQKASNDLVMVNDDLSYQEFSLYRPRFDFTSSEDYKVKIESIRNQEKDLIKSGRAVSGNQGWTVNGSKSKGNKMVKDMQKLLLRAFNCECDDAVEKVKFNNIDLSIKRVSKSKDTISSLGAMMGIEISQSYYDLKLQELSLALEYQQKKEDEKERIKEAREEQREALKLQREIDDQRKKLDKEQTHYENALATLNAQIAACDTTSPELLEKKAELESRMSEIDKDYKNLDYREANQKAGYVYIISNIGAFGKDIYKIGMTRRLEPLDRIDELGDASVPFNFDVHALIFSEDAPALETSLHNAFSNDKVNMINQRREFFNVSLDKIKEEVRKNFDKTVEFIDAPAAEQFRESIKMREMSTKE